MFAPIILFSLAKLQIFKLGSMESFRVTKPPWIAASNPICKLHRFSFHTPINPTTKIDFRPFLPAPKPKRVFDTDAQNFLAFRRPRPAGTTGKLTALPSASRLLRAPRPRKGGLSPGKPSVLPSSGADGGRFAGRNITERRLKVTHPT